MYARLPSTATWPPVLPGNVSRWVTFSAVATGELSGTAPAGAIAARTNRPTKIRMRARGIFDLQGELTARRSSPGNARIPASGVRGARGEPVQGRNLTPYHVWPSDPGG